MPRAKRPRSTVTNMDFVKDQQENVPPPEVPTLNGSSNPSIKDVTVLTQNLTVKDAKKGGDRGLKGDGTVILVGLG